MKKLEVRKAKKDPILENVLMVAGRFVYIYLQKLSRFTYVQYYSTLAMEVQCTAKITIKRHANVSNVSKCVDMNMYHPSNRRLAIEYRGLDDLSIRAIVAPIKVLIDFSCTAAIDFSLIELLRTK